MIMCCEWLLAERDSIVQQDANGNWYIENDITYSDMLIEYCPFCGNEVDEKGCINSRDN